MLATTNRPTSDDNKSEGVLTTFSNISFPEMRSMLGHFYVDKTELIEQLVTMRKGTTDLVLCPHRCGKTAMLNMLRCATSN
jgi:hypothetical protein